MAYQFRPIEQWPGQPTRQPKRSQFRVNWSKTVELLESELRHLGASNVVIQAFVDAGQIRQDGMLYANARPSRPGVILSFDSKHGPLSYPCDRYDDWRDNVRAIALSLEALRSVDRYGVTKRAEQYKGWAKLPGPVEHPAMNIQDAATLIRQYASGMQDQAIGRSNYEEMYRRACVATHPDRGGNAEVFKRIQEAKAVIDRHFQSA